MFPKERREQRDQIERQMREYKAKLGRQSAVGLSMAFASLGGGFLLAIGSCSGFGDKDYSIAWGGLKFCFWVMVAMIGTVIGAEISRDKHGPPRLSNRSGSPYGDAHWAEPEELNTAGLLGEPTGDGLFLGLDDATEQPIRYQGEKSIITIGPSGSGKLASTIAYAVALCPASIILNDPKGEAAAISAQHRQKFGKVFVLNPFNVLVDECPFMRSAAFNPLADLDPAAEDFSSDCTMLADAVIVAEGKEPYWTDSARNLVAGIIGYVCAQPGETRTLARVNEIIHLPEAAFKAVMALMAASAEDFIKNAARPFLDSNGPKSVADVLATARTQLGTFLNTKGIQRALSGDDFRWSDLKTGTATIYIVLPEDKAKAFNRFTRLIYASSLRALLRFPAKPVYYIMDELATSLGDQHLAMVETAFNLGRGFGVRLHAFFQNWPQVKAVFGDKATSLESAAGLVQYFQPTDEDTFKKMQSRGGTWTDWVQTVSTNVGHSDSSGGKGGSSSSSSGSTTSEQAFKRDLIDPETAYQRMGRLLPQNNYTGHQVLFYEGLAAPAWSIRKGYWTDPRIAGLLAPNPYKKG